MRIAEVRRGVVVLHDRRNQGRLKEWINKVGVVTSDDLFCGKGCDKPEMVEVAFFVKGHLSCEYVRFHRLKKLTAQDVTELVKEETHAKLFTALV